MQSNSLCRSYSFAFAPCAIYETCIILHLYTCILSWMCVQLHTRLVNEQILEAHFVRLQQPGYICWFWLADCGGNILCGEGQDPPNQGPVTQDVLLPVQSLQNILLPGL